MIYDNGIYRELTPEAMTARELARAEAERQYWHAIPYEDAVDAEIRKRYSVSQEFAILRQKDEKPEEYTAYYAYCEQCKAFVKAKKGETV